VIAFWILAVLLIASAVFTVTAKKPVYSVVGLLANFVCLAALYLELQAEFLAVIQIVVYSGAILILFVFVIALLSSGVRPFVVGPNRAPYVLYPAVVFAVLTLGAIALTALRTPVRILTPQSVPGSAGTAFGVTGAANAFGSVGDFGVALFTTNLLPFEVTAFILMVAVIGVVLIAGDEDPVTGVKRKRRPGKREPIVKSRDVTLTLSKGEPKS
jgi:NADH-quinone oxidoreductase subunit J